MINTVIAITLSALGIACLYRNQKKASKVLVFSGWALLIACFFFWVKAAGIEYGISYGFMFPALLVWLLIFAASDLKTKKDPKPKTVKNMAFSPKAILTNLGYFLFTIPTLAIFSTLIAVGFSYMMPFQEVNQLALCIVLQPLLWAIFSVWFFMDHYRFRPALVAFLCTLFSGFYIFL